MFSTVKSCKLLVFLGLALCLLLPGAPAFADTPMPPSHESSQCALVEPLGYTDDVVDTYWSYSCPRGVSGHSISMFNISYKTISYRNGYRRSAHHRESRLAAMCSCGVLGTTDKWQFVYSTCKNDGETAPAFSYPRRMRDCNVDDDAGPGSGRDVS